MPTIRAVIAEHLGCCTLIGAKTREHTFSVVVVSRQAQRPRGNWRTTRQTLIDAGAASLHTARGVAARVSSAIEVRPVVDHGNLGTFDRDDIEGLAAARQRFVLSTLSRRAVTYVANDATGRAACVDAGGVP